MFSCLVMQPGQLFFFSSYLSIDGLEFLQTFIPQSYLVRRYSARVQGRRGRGPDSLTMRRRLFTNTFSFALPPSNRQPAGFRLSFVLLRVVGELVKVCVEKIVATRLLHSQMMHLLLKGINCLLLVMESFHGHLMLMIESVRITIL